MTACFKKATGEMSGIFSGLRSGFKRQSRVASRGNKPLIVSFTGGIGAQIFSLAIALNLKKRGEPFGVDLSYFDQDPKLAAVGDGVSIWPWGLEYLGHSAADVAALGSIEREDGRFLPDSLLKFRMGISAMADHSVRAHFPRRASVENFLKLGITDPIPDLPYVAFHLRRGDYLNVASHVVPDDDYLGLMGRLSRTIPAAIVVSDSSLSQDFISFCEERFPRIAFLDGLSYEPGEIHHLLRNASIHVGSNGQFSLTAGLLSDTLFLTPKKFFVGLDAYDSFLSGLSNFSALDIRTGGGVPGSAE